jgi:hypothetical protein
MIPEEYLVICLIEELSEMQHALSKCLRFGPEDVCKVHGIKNIQKVNDELSDVFAIMALLEKFEVRIRGDEALSQKKIDRLIDELKEKFR